MLSHAALCTLSSLPLFKGLTPAQIAWLKNRLHVRTCSAGTNFLVAEQPGEAVYVITSGTIKIHIEQAGGADVILAILGKGDIVGEMSLIDSAGRSASALALEESILVWMDRQTFQECLANMPVFTQNLVRILSARVRLANELIQALASLDVYGRVARQILAFAERYGETTEAGKILIPIRLTQGELADLVGASRKRVNQVMVAFKGNGLISVDQEGRIAVCDRKGLARYCR